METTNKKLFYILMILAMAGWGASWVNAKVLGSYINEYELIFFRNIFTLISLLPVILFAKKSFKINFRTFIIIILASITMIVYMKFFFLGTKYGTASLGGSFVTTLIPIITFIIMALFFKKKTSKKDIFALALGAIGVLTMINIWNFGLDEIFLIHNRYFLAAALCWSLLTIISSKNTDISALVLTFYIYIVSTIMVSIFFLDVTSIDYSGFDNIFWLNILSLAFISTTFATSIYFIGIEKLGAKDVSTFIFLVPFFAISFSIIFLDEKINYSIIIGTILTIIAVSILNNIISFRIKK